MVRMWRKTPVTKLSKGFVHTHTTRTAPKTGLIKRAVNIDLDWRWVSLLVDLSIFDESVGREETMSIAVPTSVMVVPRLPIAHAPASPMAPKWSGKLESESATGNMA